MEDAILTSHQDIILTLIEQTGIYPTLQSVTADEAFSKQTQPLCFVFGRKNANFKTVWCRKSSDRY